MRGKTLIVAEKVAKRDVDHRLPLRIYYRAADSILRQAAIYRKENNLIDLYVLLLRFSSLVMETIPQHRDYRTFLGREKPDFKKRVLDVLNELEALKPRVQTEVSRYNNVYSSPAPSTTVASRVSVAAPPRQLLRSQTVSGISTVKDPFESQSWTGDLSSKPSESRRQEYNPQLGYNLTYDTSSRCPDTQRQEVSSVGYNWTQDFNSRSIDQGRREVPQPGYALAGDLTRQTFGVQRHEYSQASTTWIENVSCRPVDVQRQYSQAGSIRNQNVNNMPFSSGSVYPNYGSSTSIVNSMQNLSLSVPSATSETLSRHSFLGPTSLRRSTQPLRLPTKVAYPSLIDTAPITVPSLEQSWRTPMSGPTMSTTLSPDPSPLQQADLIKLEEKQSSLIETAVVSHSQLIRQPSPPPVQAEVQSITATLEQELGCSGAQPCEIPSSQAEPLEPPEVLARPMKPKPLHIAAVLMEEFMKVAKSNTRSNLETCGVLAGSLKEGVFYVTTLIIPKQEATSNSCSTINEEELFEFQDKNELFQFGWIHTHPTQSCFMSSIDLHTHYSYQVMLQEAVAIVMAPTDSSRKYGIFRLSEPSGLKTIQCCDKRGFHPHDMPSDGGPIYETSAHVLLSEKVPCNVVDLR